MMDASDFLFVLLEEKRLIEKSERLSQKIKIRRMRRFLRIIRALEGKPDRSLTPLPPAGREIARFNGVIESVMHKTENLCTEDCVLTDWNTQCKADLHEQTGSGNAAPGPRCPHHAAPGTTPVEVIVRERETK